MSGLEELPFLLFADPEGNIYEHPELRMSGFWAMEPAPLWPDDLIPMPEFSKLFYLPGCPAVGVDPKTAELVELKEVQIEGEELPCFAVAAFLEPGYVRTHLPAANYEAKTQILPTWAYGAVGFKDDKYWVAAFQIEYNPRWDPRNYDDRELIEAIKAYPYSSPLVQHLSRCAVDHHCFAAKNLFLVRWEAPLPVSRVCNASCLGCLSLQSDHLCMPSHHLIEFTPSVDEIVTIATHHLESADKAIVSFGQGCEGEPLTQWRLIKEAIAKIRAKTKRGTINLNTNGSIPEKVVEIGKAGLDSVRISLNSARAEFYHAYYRPKGYGYYDVVESIRRCRDMGLYTMVNYLVFPGISDREAEVEALLKLIKDTGVNFIHFKNLNIDPKLYLDKMPSDDSPIIGLKGVVEVLGQEAPDVELGYFNKPVGDKKRPLPSIE